MTKKRNYRWLMRQSAISRNAITLTIFLSITTGILTIIQAWILAHLINQVTTHQTITTYSKHYFVGLALIIIGRALTTGFREKTAFETARKIKSAIRSLLFDTLFQQQPDTVNKKKAGALATTIIENVEALHDFYSDYLPQMTIIILLPLIILVLVFMQNWVAGTILLITAPLIPLFMALIGMGVEALNQKQFKSLSRISGHFLDMLQGLTTLSLYHRAQAQLSTIEQKSDTYRIKTMQVLKVAFLSSAVLELFSTVSIAIVAVYLGLGLLHIIHFGLPKTFISLQSAFFILLLAPEFFVPLRQLGTFYHARAEAIAAVTDLVKFTEEYSNDKNTAIPPRKKLTAPISAIILSDISFRYPNKKDLFTHLSFRANTGECIAITGDSGTGKSTLLKLICLLQYPTQGSLLVNDINLSTLDTEWWRQQVSLLTQNPYLFHATICDNIRLAKPKASLEEIQQAASRAGVLSFTDHFPDKLNTIIGEQNIGLSGGQAQRVALARAYLKNAPILLLDEPTAHLDQENKQVIINALEQWQNQKIILIATHDNELRQFCHKEINLGPL